MNKKVCIKISGLHGAQSEQEDDAIEVINVGTYCRRNGKHLIKYDEAIEDEGRVSQNLLKISDNEIEIITKGTVGSHMVFSIGHKNTTYYTTPFGAMNMGIDTYDLNITEEENIISADIRYGLEINLDYVAECSVHIDIESIEE